MQNVSAVLLMTFVLVLAFCLSEVGSTLSEDQNNVIKVINDTNACAEKESCFTLNGLVASKDDSIVSNTKIVLSPTSHSLNSFGIVLISHVSNLTFTTESEGVHDQSHITCNGTAGFLFQFVDNYYL